MPNSAGGSGKGLVLREVAVQNLRGFIDASLSFRSPVVFLVGPNNSGKTSFFRLLDVLFNWELDREFEAVSDDLMQELMPARQTRNSARRLTLKIEVADARRHSRLQCRDGVATLRLSLKKARRVLQLNLGDPRRGETHSTTAEALLGELRETFSFAHIPASRSADSDQFQQSTLDAIAASLASAFEKPGKGADRMERAASGAVASVRRLSQPAQEFWETLVGRLPDGWIRGQRAQAELDRDALSRFLAERILLNVTTGAHDADGVRPGDVGSGLQSLISIEFHRMQAEQKGRELLLAVEEPEAFLHPAAQRDIGRRLSSGKLAHLTLVSTHSPLIAEEASFEQIAIVRDHRIRQPQIRAWARAAINSTLMQNQGAEAVFARSVLLVEGPGDRQYWEALRRRLAPFDTRMAVDQCFVIAAGSNANCAPWLRLFRSFPGSPIRWMVLLDSDSASHLETAARQSMTPVSPRQRLALDACKKAYADNDLQRIEEAAKRLAAVERGESKLLLAPGDLESIMCAGLTHDTEVRICKEIGLKDPDAAPLSQRLGTKHRPEGKATRNSKKDPWARSRIGQLTPPAEIDQFVYGVLEAWVAGASTRQHGSRVIQKFRSSKKPAR